MPASSTGPDSLTELKSFAIFELRMSPDTDHKKRLGRYHVTEYIGSGPCGEIHEARLDGVGRTFALKRFHESYVADSLVASGVAAAAKQYLSLQHPRIARLHSFVTVDEHTLAAVELIDGISLDLLLESAKLPIGAWAKLIVQLGRGIGYAHGRGLCHLGISPTNVICVASGSISITDFGFLAPGLAKVAELDLGERQGYLAPEQLEGKRSSPASDVYSMGTIAYHLMTGAMPYGELSGKALREAILSAPIPEPDLPKPFKKLVQRALARSPFERFSDAGAMADAMEAAMRSEPLPGSLSDIGKLVFEQLGVGADEGENIVKSFNDIPTVIPGQTSPIDGMLTGVPDAEIEVSQTEPYVADIPKQVQNEMPISSGAPDVFLGPAGSGPTGSGQQFIGGNPVSIGDSPSLSAEFADDFSETDVFEKREPEAPVVERLPLQRAPTTSEFETREIPVATPTENGFADFPSIEDEYTEQSLVQDKEETTAGDEQTEIEDALGEFSLPTKVYPDDIAIPGASVPEVVASEVVVLGADDLEIVSMGASSPEVVAPGNATATKTTGRNDGRWLKFGVAALVLVSAGGLGYNVLFSDKESKTGEDNTSHLVAKPAPTHDAKVAVAEQRDAAVVIAIARLDAGSPQPLALDASVALSVDGAIALADRDAGAMAMIGQDAAVIEGVMTGQDAAVGKTVAGQDTPPPTEGELLRIESTPSGAAVYIDGTLLGKTPVSVDASLDRHRLALLLPGYNLHTADVDGVGVFNIELSEVTPGGGPGGIKVRCRKKNRYYIFVDGNPTGELCPSERIGVPKGRHVVEIYDPVSDSRREFKAVVTGTRASLRLRVD